VSAVCLDTDDGPVTNMSSQRLREPQNLAEPRGDPQILCSEGLRCVSDTGDERVYKRALARAEARFPS